MNLKSDNMLPEAFLKALQPTEKYFIMAENATPINDIHKFNISWIGLQRVCYIIQDKEKETVVRMNFPTLPMHLK